MAAEKKLEQLINNAPESMQSVQTAQSGEALANAEAQGVPQGYNDTYSGKLDKAIDNWLASQGLGAYTPNRDKAYRQYAEQYQKNLNEGRSLASNTAVNLAGGWKPQYSGAVASEVYNDQMADVTAAIPQFETIAENERLAEQNQQGNVVNLYNTLDSTNYSRSRDSVQDYKNYLAALSERYNTDRTSDVQNSANMTDVYNTILTNAQAQAEEERNAENNRYLFNTQSADSKAQIAENEYENNQKIAYNKAKDEYDARMAELKEAENMTDEENIEAHDGNTRNAQMVYAGMRSKKDFENAGFGLDEDEADASEKIYGSDGVTTYEAYAKNHIDDLYNSGQLTEQERDYLYLKTGISGIEAEYFNGGVADSYIRAYDLDRANDTYILNQLAIGTDNGDITLDDADYIMKKLGVGYDLTMKKRITNNTAALQAEQRAIDSNERYKKVKTGDSTGEWIVSFDKNGRYKYEKKE